VTAVADMALNVAQTISQTTRSHLETGGLVFGQCLTAVGWVGGTVPEMTEEEGIIELAMADVSGPGIAVGAALVGRRPIYVIRYQGFMWYNAAPILNYAAKSKDMWGVPCPICVRALAMEGGIGPVASAAHHGMAMRMPGIAVYAPMTPGEWKEGWDWFMANDDPIYFSEHRRSLQLDQEMSDILCEHPDITIFAISAARLNALEAIATLEQQGVTCDLVHLRWLKPFEAEDRMLGSLANSKLGLVIDTDFEVGGPARGIAHELMLKASVPVHALGLEEKSAGFAPHLDNLTPPPERICNRIRTLLDGRTAPNNS
jgi:acetoin:2,6-dichlorophenolindophenol oxidoreductase subunit beta